MTSVPEPPNGARDLTPDGVAAHLAEQRRRISLLGEIREVVFGAQDGLVSTLAVVATVAAATSDRLTVLIAGLASAVAGIFSMSVGEYMGSKSQAEIFRSQIRDELEEVRGRPEEASAELAMMFTEEGLSTGDADAVVAVIRRYPESLLATMVAKELGLVSPEHAEAEGSPLRGALFMGGAFAAGAIVPLAPYLVSSGLGALAWSAALTGGALFVLGAIKSRWSGRSWVASGLEILSLAAFAGVAGYLFGSVLPTMLGFAAP
jgi:vacuolar iron transporter family protein